LPNRRIAAPAVEPKQFAPVAIVFRTAGKDGVTTERLRRCDAVSQATKSPLSRRAVPKRILAMTAPRLVMARAPALARDAPPRHRRRGSSATAPTFDRSPRRSGTTRDDTHDLRSNVVPRGTVRRRRPAGCANQRFRLRRRDRLRGPLARLAAILLGIGAYLFSKIEV